MCADQERFVSRWIPSNLNVETRSIAPDEVKRGGKFIEVRGPRPDYVHSRASEVGVCRGSDTPTIYMGILICISPRKT